MGNVAGDESTVRAPDDSEMVIDKESRTAGRGSYPNDNLSAKNIMGNNPGVKPGLHIEKANGLPL